MGNRYPRPYRLSLGQQVAGMQCTYPAFKAIWKSNKVSWIGMLQPTAMSVKYEVMICYKLEDLPEVFVLEPELKCRENESPIPHVYPENRLCLYLPRSGEWHPGIPIADTIVPWIALWLYYYEIWHVTGEWVGGGVHPRQRNKQI